MTRVSRLFIEVASRDGSSIWHHPWAASDRRTGQGANELSLHRHRVQGAVKLHSGKSNIAGWKIPILDREYIFKRFIFQPAMVVYQRITSTWDFVIRTLSTDQLTLMMYIGDEMLIQFIGTIINHHRVPYKPISKMKCQPRVLNVAHLFF